VHVAEGHVEEERVVCARAALATRLGAVRRDERHGALDVARRQIRKVGGLLDDGGAVEQRERRLVLRPAHASRMSAAATQHERTMV